MLGLITKGQLYLRGCRIANPGCHKALVLFRETLCWLRKPKIWFIVSVPIYLSSSIWGICFSSKQIVQTHTANKILVKLKYFNNIFYSSKNTTIGKETFSILK